MSSWYTSIIKKESLLTLAKQGWYHSKRRCSPISVCPKSNPFYQPLLPATYSACIPGKCGRLHGRRKGRKRRYRQRWSKNGQSSSEGKSGKVYFCCGRKLRVSSIYLFDFYLHARSWLMEMQRAGNYGMCGRAYSPRFLFMWPNARISVMGPDQLSTVMHTVQGKRAQENGKAAEDAERKRQELRDAIEKQSMGIYSTARLWVSLLNIITAGRKGRAYGPIG